MVVLHHGISIAWQWQSGNAELADGMVLLRWLKEHGLPGVLPSNSERPERLAWIAAMPPALEEMAGDLVGHFETPADSSRAVRARERMQVVDPVTRVLQLLAWNSAGVGRGSKHPPPIAEIIAALQDPQADQRHDVGAARILLAGNSRIKQRLDVARLPGPPRVRLREAVRGHELPQWAERLLLNA